MSHSPVLNTRIRGRKRSRDVPGWGVGDADRPLLSGIHDDRGTIIVAILNFARSTPAKLADRCLSISDAEVGRHASKR